MNEDFLHYVWKFQQFSSFDLKTTEGSTLQIVHVGQHNQNAGPDFLNAKLRIGDTLWAGNVEIHIRASDWFKHGHQTDPAYDNVILHVVYSADQEIKSGKGHVIPCLVLKDLIDYQNYRKYKAWLLSAGFIPCEGSIHQVPTLIKTSAVEAAAVERLNNKAAICLDHLNQTRGDIEGSFYRILLRSFGLKVNALPFEQLSLITPFNLIRKVSPKLSELEALLFGQAGFLAIEDKENEYLTELQQGYLHLRHKYQLSPMPISAWKLFRLRPQNFPQLRIAQIAHFYHKNQAIAQKLVEDTSLPALEKIFSIRLNHLFWDTHYSFEKESKKVSKSLGIAALHSIIINAVVPFLFALSLYNKDFNLRDRALSLLEELPVESNSVVRKFSLMNFDARSALDSQGIIQLKKYHCDEKKCLTCRIGTNLLKEK